MRSDPGATERQRQLAANEDAACSISMGWRAGRRDEAENWQIWLAHHNVTREVAWRLAGLEPSPIAGMPPILGRPVAISEYQQTTSAAIWLDVEGGTLGMMSAGDTVLYWFVATGCEIPRVTLDPDREPERSTCCGAAVVTLAPLLLQGDDFGFKRVSITSRVCSRCQGPV
jgi:hypothetical protein